MAEQGLKMVGKDPVGNAKAIRTDSSGNLGVQISEHQIRSVTSLNAATATGNGTSIDCTGGTAFINVTGTFSATLRIYAVINGIATIVPTYKIDNTRCIGARYRDITEAGCYMVIVQAGTTSLYVRCQSYGSGSVTAIINVTSENNMTYAQLISLYRNMEIARASGSTVVAGATTAVITAIDIASWPYQYIAVRTNSSHAFKVYFNYTTTVTGPLGAPLPDILVLDSSTAAGDSTRKYIEWYEAKGAVVTVRIQNLDTSDHTYDLYLYGVR